MMKSKPCWWILAGVFCLLVLAIFLYFFPNCQRPSENAFYLKIPIIPSAITPQSEQVTNDKFQIRAYFIKEIMEIFHLIIGFILGLIGGIVVGNLKRKRDGRDQFLAVTADLRAGIPNAGLGTERFFRESIKILRPAIFQVKPFAEDWGGLYECWKQYEQTDPKSFRWDQTVPINTFTGQGKTAEQNLRDFLDKFDHFVG